MARSNLEAENQRLRDLLVWVGQKIQALNVNGRRSDKFCLICKKTTVRGPQCRHREIWEVMAEEFRKVPDPQAEFNRQLTQTISAISASEAAKGRDI